ncbi:DVU0298 family protein [Desulfoscipio geothermicus]|nr:DVU0298 family protein [Desulfoscipio geothermicus]
MMNQASKQEFVKLLEERKFIKIAELVIQKRGTVRYLKRLLYSTETLLRWRAIEAMGVVVDKLAESDPEGARNIIRSLFWSINDESGGIGWSAPECMGEIIYRRPIQFKEFASIILSFTDEEMLRRGVVWAAGRIAQASPDLVRAAVPEMLAFLSDPDPVLRGYVLRFLFIIGEKLDNRYRHLLDDRSTVPLYEDGVLRETTVAELAVRLLPEK